MSTQTIYGVKHWEVGILTRPPSRHLHSLLVFDAIVATVMVVDDYDVVIHVRSADDEKMFILSPDDAERLSRLLAKAAGKTGAYERSA